MAELPEIVLKVLVEHPEGLTFEELEEVLKRRWSIDTYHGTLSGLLSNLHSDREVFYLKQRRNNKAPYVHKRFRNMYVDTLRVDLPRKNKWRQIADDLYDVMTRDHVSTKEWNKALQKYKEAIDGQ